MDDYLDASLVPLPINLTLAVMPVSPSAMVFFKI
jgi:hypothetical protein